MVFPIDPAQFNRHYAILAGRGTAALWLALKAIRERDGSGEVILPDLICSTVLEGVLLAGFTPRFAQVHPTRYTIDPASVHLLLNHRTRAIIVAHLFGHGVDIASIREVAPNIPIIEDAVQGLGGNVHGNLIGTMGDISFISFDSTKMIGGRGGMVMTDDPELATSMQSYQTTLGNPTMIPKTELTPLLELFANLPATAAEAYASYLDQVASSLLTPFNADSANLERIRSDWMTLFERVHQRFDRSIRLRDALSNLDIGLPDLHIGDALWRFCLVAPNAFTARRILHGLQRAGLSGSPDYFPMSTYFSTAPMSPLTNRLVNLWIDENTTEDALQQSINVVRSAMKDTRATRQSQVP